MPYARASRQRGESLISLMLGLLLSTVVALAMLSMFKVSARYGGQAGQDAAADIDVRRPEWATCLYCAAGHP